MDAKYKGFTVFTYTLVDLNNMFALISQFLSTALYTE